MHSISSTGIRFFEPRLSNQIQAIYIRNPLLLRPLEQVQALLSRLQRLRIHTQIARAPAPKLAVLRILAPVFGLGSPDLPLLPVNLGHLELAGAVERKAAHAALAAEVPVQDARVACVIREPGGIGWAQELEIIGCVHQPYVEEGHLVAR